MKTKVINLYGGPGTGKSTNAARIYTALKDQGKEVELVTEYAKDLVWEKRFKTLDDQIYIFAKQHHRLHRLEGQVEYIVTDSPILLSVIYDVAGWNIFKDLVLESYNNFDNVDYFLKRIKAYSENGRMQTLEEAKELDKHIINMLNECEIRYSVAEGSAHGVVKILQDLDYDTG